MAYPQYPKTYKKQFKIGDKDVTVEIGRYSEQVNSAVLITCGETTVHTTVALGRKVDLGYFPLSVEFSEKLYAAGIIKGSRWVKREGRPSDDVILKARVIDRTLRPLFPEGITHEVQVVNTVFSYDEENDPDMLGLLGSALGMAVSEIPFDGPVAGLRLGFVKETGKFLLNPTNTEREISDLDLVVSGRGDAIVMVEAGANEVAESTLVEAMTLAQKELGQICQVIDEIVGEVGKEKMELVTEEEKQATADLEALAEKMYKDFAKEVREVVEAEGRLETVDFETIREKILARLNEGIEDEEQLVTDRQVASAFNLLSKKEARKMILEENTRPDGRKTDEIRPIWCEIDLFPRTHGSAMFKRGATQAVTITTLADPTLAQLIESIEGEEKRHYIHHYNMPPYASGEAGRMGWPKRREIGHGALAERALVPMLPDQKVFPYTIHVVSEIMSSNGSTSQASVCGSTLSLMAAGVPIKRPVAGIAMGLMSDGKKYIVLSDIQGLEDHVGDMDFKVAGTAEGVTALQMDIKLKGVPQTVLKEALDQAKVGRLHILDAMLKVISEPRKQISRYAPKVVQLEIPADKIGELIGPGGKMIKSLIEETGAEINVDEDEEREVGIVNISSSEQSQIDAAVEKISSMMRVVEIGDEFDGTVTRVESYGAFVEYLPGREGLVHVSEMSLTRIDNVNDVVKLGDTVHVRVNEIKEDGKIGLSMLSTEESEQKRSQRRPGGDRGGDGGFQMRRFGGNGRGGDRRGGGGYRGGSGGSGGYHGGDRRGGGYRGGRSSGPRDGFRMREEN
ncbi:MAG: Polyribonucleotide nucleotidyltransferase [Candidatus Pacebacteria bacterium GW2011_GWA1_46_10]|nr:MAG: Polyribonucleotide nucleotidyltransferase [Candidatus Pacebacteria bacterium GW2011_GWA1_46_10]HCR81565.1 polyribonucleotide nucleotidyltransferase [Candidatus Paceibacterota bacterium]